MRRSWRSWRRMRRRSLPRMRGGHQAAISFCSCARTAQERLVQVVGAGRLRGCGRGVVGDQRRRRGAAAAGRSGPPRPSRGWRPAASCRPRRVAEVLPQLDAQHRVRPTVGSSSTSSSGWPTRAQASEARARWPPERSLTSWSAASAEADVGDRPRRRRPARRRRERRSSGRSPGRSGRGRRSAPG